jgi:hypothetical protein
MDFIAERKGLLYVESHWPMQDKPVDLISFYPTGIRSRDYSEYVGRRAWRVGPGIYQPDSTGFAPKFALAKYDQTRPEFTEEVPIPCPKVRRGIQTRFRDGCWSKLLKRGWILA